mgnify:CR=1 FL=1
MSQDSGYTVITLRGEADAYAAPRIRSDLATAFGTEAPLVIDLSPATFIDSTIVGILLDRLARVLLRRADLLGAAVSEVVDRSGIDPGEVEQVELAYFPDSEQDVQTDQCD